MPGIKKDKWEPSDEAQKAFTDIFARFKKHEIKEGDFYFLYEVALGTLWDKRLGPKLDRAIREETR